MDPALKGLRPELLWKHFDEIRKVPRCSKNEKMAVEYVMSVAKRLKLEYKLDKAGNIVVRKPASKGKEKAPILVLQGHLDMVCEKNKETKFDFTKDAIQLRKEGNYLYARGTTLGADNGMGVAAALAVLEDKDLVHGPIEALFTIDEETGLTGAFALGKDMLKGRYLLNLDSEEDGAIYVGCAGGGETEVHMDLKRTKAEGKAYKLVLSGLKGGHSGVDILLGRANALKMLGRMLYKGYQAGNFHLAEIIGGDKHNAIPREAEAVIVLEKADRKLMKALEDEFKAIMFEFRSIEPTMKYTAMAVDLPKKMIKGKDTRCIIELIMALPHGVYRMSPDIKDLVETSTNLSKIRTEDGFYAQLASRSSSKTQLEALRDHVEAIASLSGADAVRNDAYPGWLPNLNSKTLAVLKECAHEVWGKEAEIKAIHAGLETGIIGEKYPGMDMASIGPQIENPHSPDERVKVDTVEGFYKMVSLALKKLC